MRRGSVICNRYTLGKKANIKSLRRYCLEIWSELVKQRDGHKCVICGVIKYVQSHHIITRMYAPTRYDPNCGLSLCAKHHEFGLASAARSPWIIYEWLQVNRPDQYKWFLEHKDGVKNPIKMVLNVQFYRSTLKFLLNIFEELYPQVLKLNKYTPFTQKEELEICKDYVDRLLSRYDLAMKYGTNEQVIKTILKRHRIKMRKPGHPKNDFLDRKELTPYDVAR
jgi:hypothetical protein